MPAELFYSGDQLVVFKVTGKLSPDELADIQAETAAHIRTHGKVAILVVTIGFEGWTRSPEWGKDLSFQFENDGHILRMAIVGEKKWEELALLFTAQGTRPFPIQYFASGDLAMARVWLAQ